MAARVVELKQAIADYIESSTYSFTFNTNSTYPIKIDLAETRLTNVWVYPLWPTGKRLTVNTRGTVLKQYLMNVEITNYIDNPDNQSEIDDALLLAEELEDSLDNVPQADFKFTEFAAEPGGQPFADFEKLGGRNYFHVPIGVLYVGK